MRFGKWHVEKMVHGDACLGDCPWEEQNDSSLEYGVL